MISSTKQSKLNDYFYEQIMNTSRVTDRGEVYRAKDTKDSHDSFTVLSISSIHAHEKTGPSKDQSLSAGDVLAPMGQNYPLSNSRNSSFLFSMEKVTAKKEPFYMELENFPVQPKILFPSSNNPTNVSLLNSIHLSKRIYNPHQKRRSLLDTHLAKDGIYALAEDRPKMFPAVRLSVVEIRESSEFNSTISNRESNRCSNSTDISSQEQ